MLIVPLIAWQNRSEASQTFVTSDAKSLIIRAETRSQGTNCEQTSENGSVLRILPSTIILRVKNSMKGPPSGSLKTADSNNGK
jgi:hypothetical protein